jgi:hypothetical protein
MKTIERLFKCTVYAIRVIIAVLNGNFLSEIDKSKTKPQ